jgi:peptidoglycan/LPS O-acetylase OafA/YrhL
MLTLQPNLARPIATSASIATSTAKTHLPFLDGLRALAALFVVMYHMWLESWPAMYYPGNPEFRPHGLAALLTGWLAFGHIAVTVFIAISGYCLMLPITKGDGSLNVIKFLRRRARRILPPYYAALGISLVLCLTVLKPGTYTLSDIAFPVNFVSVVSHFLLVQNFNANEFQISVPLWSVAVEVQIYCLFPILLWLRRKSGGMLLPLFVSAVVGFGACRFLISRGMSDRSTHYLFIFALGMLAADLAAKWKARPAKIKTAMIAVLPALLLLGLVAHRLNLPGYSKDLTDTLVGISMCILLTFLSLYPNSQLSKLISSRPLVKIGTMSYSLYLLHFPVLQLFWQFIIAPSGMSRSYAFITLMLVAMPLILLLSFVFFQLVEKRFLYAKPISPAVELAPETALPAEVLAAGG